MKKQITNSGKPVFHWQRPRAAIPQTRFPIRSLIVNATNYSFVLRVKSKYRNGTHSGKQTVNVRISNNMHNSYLFSHF